MSEREPTNPELAAALRAYEIELRDGTERSQKETFARLRQVQQALGNAALVRSKEDQASSPTTNGEEQLAAS